MQFATGDLAVIAVMRYLPACFDLGEHIAFARRVVDEHIERVLARVKTRLTSFHVAVMLVRLTDLELIATTLHVHVEAFVGGDRARFSRRRLVHLSRFLLRGHQNLLYIANH